MGISAFYFDTRHTYLQGSSTPNTAMKVQAVLLFSAVVALTLSAPDVERRNLLDDLKNEFVKALTCHAKLDCIECANCCTNSSFVHPSEYGACVNSCQTFFKTSCPTTVAPVVPTPAGYTGF